MRPRWARASGGNYGGNICGEATAQLGESGLSRRYSIPALPPILREAQNHQG